MESEGVDPEAFKSVARYLSPHTLERLAQTGLTVVKNVAEVESDPVYWMKQLALLANLRLDYNDVDSQGVPWKKLYIRVLNKGIEELLYQKNSKLLRIVLYADEYSNDVLDEAIKYGGFETLKIIMHNISLYQFKECNQDLFAHAWRLGDYPYFLEFLDVASTIFRKNREKEYVAGDTERYLAKKITDSVSNIPKNVVKGNNIDIQETFLTALEKSDLLNDESLEEYFVNPAMKKQNTKFIDYLAKRNYKEDAEIDVIYSIVESAIVRGKYIIVNKYIDELDWSTVNFTRLLKKVSKFRNLRTVNIILDKEKMKSTNRLWGE